MATAAPADTATAQEIASAVKQKEAMPEAQPDHSAVQQAEPASDAAPEQIPGAVKTVAQVGRAAQAGVSGACGPSQRITWWCCLGRPPAL